MYTGSPPCTHTQQTLSRTGEDFIQNLALPQYFRHVILSLIVLRSDVLAITCTSYYQALAYGFEEKYHDLITEPIDDLIHRNSIS